MRKLISIAKKRILDLGIQLHPQPIFVLGNQKSGTTAIAALLAMATDKTVTLDIKGFYEPVQSQIFSKQKSFKKIIRNHAKRDFSREIIKEPCLTFMYNDFVLPLYPDSKVVFILRNPFDNIRSILNRLNINGQLEKLNSTTPLSPEWRKVVYNDWLGLEYENYIESMAKRWNLAVDIYLEHQSNMHLVRYEDFNVSKKEFIHKLARELDLEVINDISEKLDFAFQKPGNSFIRKEQFFNKSSIKLIYEICQERMNQFGYN